MLKNTCLKITVSSPIFFELYEFEIDENGEISELTKKELENGKIKSDACN